MDPSYQHGCVARVATVTTIPSLAVWTDLLVRTKSFVVRCCFCLMVVLLLLFCLFPLACMFACFANLYFLPWFCFLFILEYVLY
jgi:hypothetical protein